MAVRKPEETALRTARVLALFRTLFVVPLFVLRFSVKAVLALLRMPEQVPEEKHSEEELRIILEQSQTGGVMSFRRLLLMENVFDLGDLRVRDAMRSRASVKALEAGAEWAKNVDQIKRTRLTRFPLLVAGQDKPFGVVHAKDVLVSLLDGPAAGGVDLRAIARPYVTVEEGTPLETLHAELQRRRVHMAIVVDKNDRWTGLITLEDVFEEIVGTVEDEFETEPRIFLADVLTAGRVVLGVEAPSLEEAVRRTLARIPQSELPRPREALAKLVLDRSRLVGTYLGRGLSIPHARADGLDRPVLIFARSNEGVPVEGRADEKSYFHFILVTPTHQPHVHVRLLARIGGIFESEYVEERLREATSPQEVLEAIRAGEAAALG